MFIYYILFQNNHQEIAWTYEQEVNIRTHYLIIDGLSLITILALNLYQTLWSQFCLPCNLLQMMKKEEKRSLQDQFSSLFRQNNHQQSQNQNSETNLLDSYEPSQQLNPVSFKQVKQTQSQSQEQDFLDQVDDILGHGQQNEEQLTRREIMLNFKINELKLMCKNLKMANIKLAERIEQLQRPRSEIVENTVQLSRSQDLTMMQQQFCEIQQELSSYKQQLAKYQQQTASQLAIKNQQIARIKKELNQILKERDAYQRELKEKDAVITLLQQRNEQLLLNIEDLETSLENQNMKGSRGHNRDSHSNFNEKISYEMESMIDKLLNQLKYQKKNSSKHLAQIKRLNNQIINIESKLKEKNNKVYELQLTIIKMHKQPTAIKSKNFKKDYESKDQSLTGYLPHRNYTSYLQANKNNKSQSNVRVINKNRVSAERQQVNTGKSNNFANVFGLSKVFSTFTLMDLMNKEFKIRTAQKYVIVCRVIEVYATKLQRGDYSNLISEQLEVYNFNSQAPGQLKVRVNPLNRSQGYQTSEQSMLYNMAFIIDILLNQVEVLDPYQGSLELNIPSFIQEVLNKQGKDEKCRLLTELANSIEREYLS